MAEERRGQDPVLDLLMPARLPRPQGYDVVTYLDPGRDPVCFAWDFFELDGSTIAFATFEILPPSRPLIVVLGAARGFLHAQVLRSPLPVKVLGALNKFVYETWNRNVRMHATYSLLDLSRNSIASCSCGDLPLVFYSAQQKQAAVLRQNQPPLGDIDPRGFREKVTDFRTTIQKGDWMVMFNCFLDGGRALMALLGNLAKRNRPILYQEVLSSILAVRRQSSDKKPRRMLGFIGLAQKQVASVARAVQGTGRLRKCRFCEHMNETYTDVCVVCKGSLIDARLEIGAREDEFQCPNCGGLARKGSRSCGKCGTVFCRVCRQRAAGKGRPLCDACWELHAESFGE